MLPVSARVNAAVRHLLFNFMKFEIKQILFGVVFLALSCLSITGQEQKPPQEIPTIAYCDLVREPIFYDNKVVRISVNYIAAFEGSIIRDSDCDGKDTWVRFDAKVKDATPRKIWKKFDRLTDTSPEYKNGGVNYPSRLVKVTWIGLFQGVKRAQKIGNLTLPLGYGHMNGFDFQFVVQKVETVSKIASN